MLRPSRAHLETFRSFPDSCQLSQLEQRIALGGTDEVIFGKPVDGVRAVRNGAMPPADFQIGMMFFAVRNPRQGIDESHSSIIVLERVLLPDSATIERPALQLIKHFLGFNFA